MTTSAPPTPPPVKPFTDWLKEQRNGLTQAELTDALHDLVAAVSEHGKGGELTLTVKVKPAGKNIAGTVTVSDAIKVRAPEGDRPESIFFIDPANNDLLRNDPRQRRLPLDDTAEVR